MPPQCPPNGANAFPDSQRLPGTHRPDQRGSLGQNSVRTPIRTSMTGPHNGAAPQDRAAAHWRLRYDLAKFRCDLTAATSKSKSMIPKRYAAAYRRFGWTIPALLLTLSAVAAPAAQAQDYPTHTVKIIVPFPAGGTADVMPRVFADWLSRKWG